MQYGVAGSAAFLECQPRSPQATVKWLFQRDPSDRRREVSSYVPQGANSALWVWEFLFAVGARVGETEPGSQLGAALTL